MILFDADLYLYNCTIDIKTTNKSFLRMAVLLESMGVKNNKFFLALYDKGLQGVDPHAENLTFEQKLQIARECKTNPWYFFREVLRIPASGGDPVPYLLNRANLAGMWCFFTETNVFLTMPRQIGKTMFALGICAYYLYIRAEAVDIGMFTKDDSLRTDNVNRIKDIRDTIPPYLIKMKKKYHTNNQESIEYYPNKTKIKTFVAQSSATGADKQGRGATVIWSLWDEFAKYVNNHISFDVASSASDAAMDNARKNGLPCAHMITTTAGYLDTPYGKYAHDVMTGALKFTEHLYDTGSLADLKDVISRSSNGYCYLEYSHSQLGKSDEWFKVKTRGKSSSIILTDYCNKWIHGSGSPVIPKRLLDKLNENVEDPVSVTIEDGIVMRWFATQDTLKLDAHKNVPYIIGCDSSDNIGEDFTTLVMLDPRDMSVVMQCRCNEASMVYVCNIIFNLLGRFPRSVFIPERNRIQTLLDNIIHLIVTKTKWNVFTRIYSITVQDKGDSVNYKTLDLELGSVRKMFGFYTGAQSRKTLYKDVLSTTIERNYSRIFDKTIIDEISGLTERNGRIDHGASGNDDTLIAYLIACWFIMYGKNVELYGIDPSEILTSNGSDSSESSTSYELLERKAYLEDKLESTGINSLMKHAYTAELADINRMMPVEASICPNVISMHQVDNMENKVSKTLSTDQTLQRIISIF